MSRFGVPMYAPLQECRVIVHVDAPGHPLRLVTWRGPSARAIHRAAKEFYAPARVAFGVCWWVTL